MTAAPFHGAQLIMALPMYAGQDEPDHYVIVVKHGDEYVCAMANTLADPDWYWGHYYVGTPVGAAGAVAAAYVRAYVTAFSREQLTETASKGVISR